MYKMMTKPEQMLQDNFLKELDNDEISQEGVSSSSVHTKVTICLPLIKPTETITVVPPMSHAEHTSNSRKLVTITNGGLDKVTGRRHSHKRSTPPSSPTSPSCS